MPALLFGSISTLADTSELQRRAFNEAFAAHGLAWTWERHAYAEMLREPGGADRVAAYARERGEEVDADAVRRTKTDFFHKLLASEEVVPRAGVVDTIWAAKNAGCKIGFVTTTSADNVAALLSALRMESDLPEFDAVINEELVENPKPDPEAYVTALRMMRQRHTRCVAIEDNVAGVQAAVAAGLPCAVFPNDNTAGHFDRATCHLDRLDFGYLRRFTDPT